MFYLRNISKENKEIFNNGFYVCENEKVYINDIVDKSINETELFEDIIGVDEVNNTKPFSVSENIMSMGTTDCAIKLRNNSIKGNIIALNFANATIPGGGYLIGAKAQEECLCRASMLYPTLTSKKEMYFKNILNYSPLYNDRMIYSPDVPIIRNDNQELIKPKLCSFITSPAVNRSMAKKLFIPNSKINDVMKKRIYKIISLALSKNPEVIILGAFGCGVFGNKRDVVFKIFEDVISMYVDLDKVKIIFAII